MGIENLDFSQARIVTPETEGQPTVITEAATTETATSETSAATTEADKPAPETSTETTPAVETTAAATPEATTTEETTTTTTHQESPDEVFSRMLREKYGVDSLEDYLVANKQEEKAPSETIKKLMEWESKGLKPEDYFRTQSQDFEAMSDVDKVRNLLAIENPDLTPEDIELLIEDEFKTNEEEYDERTVKLGQLKLKQRAKDALPKLKDWQVKAATAPEDNTAQQVQAQVAAYHSLVDAQLKDFNAIEVSIGDKGETFSMDISADKKGIESMVKDVNAFFSEFVAQDAAGVAQYKVKEMAEALYFAKNRHTIAKAIAKQVQSKSVQKIEQEINNSPNPEVATPPTSQQNTPLGILGTLASKGLI